MRNGVQLIAYVNRLGGDLVGLRELLEGPLSGVFTGVHVLPCFVPFDGADAGFDPIDHRAVDPRLGSWEDVAALGRSFDVTADLIVNHMSSESREFRDVLERGGASPYASMFLTADRVFPGGAEDGDVARIFRPRPGAPFTAFTLADGSRALMWTTFTPSQVDIDVTDDGARRYLLDILDRFAAANIAQVRLDAVGYAVKTAGTSCFMAPETFTFIDELSRWVHERGMEVLVEIHANHTFQQAIAPRVDRVYDFALPPLVLHAFSTGSARVLGRWLEVAPRNAITVLDTHDGIGVIDVAPDGDRPGLLSEREVDALVESIHRASGGESRAATGAAARNLSRYQVNCTFLSAVGGDEQRYLAARVLQLFAPGIPQVYYAGFLAARNDMELLARTGIGRDINRPYYDAEAMTAALERPVVRRQVELFRWRNRHPAFGGEFSMRMEGESVLVLRWDRDSAWAEAAVDVATDTFSIAASPPPPVLA